MKRIILILLIGLTFIITACGLKNNDDKSKLIENEDDNKMDKSSLTTNKSDNQVEKTGIFKLDDKIDYCGFINPLIDYNCPSCKELIETYNPSRNEGSIICLITVIDIDKKLCPVNNGPYTGVLKDPDYDETNTDPKYEEEHTFEYEWYDCKNLPIKVRIDKIYAGKPSSEQAVGSILTVADDYTLWRRESDGRYEARYSDPTIPVTEIGAQYIVTMRKDNKELSRSEEWIRQHNVLTDDVKYIINSCTIPFPADKNMIIDRDNIYELLNIPELVKTMSEDFINSLIPQK